MLYRILIHDEVASVLDPMKHILRFILNGLKDKPYNTLIHEESLKINVS